MDSKYIQQYLRIKRWRDSIGSANCITSLSDAGYSFFTCCWHLWDWIYHDETLDKTVRDSVYSFAKNSKYLKICESICVASKHASIEDPNISKNTSLEGVGYLYNLSGPGATFTKFHLRVYADGEEYDFLKLAENCINEWDKFFTKHNVPFV